MFQQAISHELPLSCCLLAFPGSCSPLLPWQGWELLPTPAQDGEMEPKKILIAVRLPYQGSQSQDS